MLIVIFLCRYKLVWTHDKIEVFQPILRYIYDGYEIIYIIRGWIWTGNGEWYTLPKMLKTRNHIGNGIYEEKLEHKR